MSKQTYYAIINRGSGKGNGTRIKLTERKHPYILSYINYYKEELDKLHAENGSAQPVKFVNDFEWDNMERETAAKFELKTIQIIGFGNKEYVNIAHFEMRQEIIDTIKLAENARADRMKKTKELKLEAVFTPRTKKLIQKALIQCKGYSDEEAYAATLGDLILLEEVDFDRVHGFGPKAKEEVEKILDEADIQENVIRLK